MGRFTRLWIWIDGTVKFNVLYFPGIFDIQCNSKETLSETSIKKVLNKILNSTPYFEYKNKRIDAEDVVMDIYIDFNSAEKLKK